MLLLKKEDITEFSSATQNKKWAERWLVTNARPGEHVRQKTQVYADEESKIKVIDIRAALRSELIRREEAISYQDDPRSAMQQAAVKKALSNLERTRGSNVKYKGWADDESRGQIIMPCGTGKTRVGYDTARGLIKKLPRSERDNNLVVVLAPSIGLVRQLRLAWLDCAERRDEQIETLSVCSDKGVTSAAGLKEQEEKHAETSMSDPTEDRSLMHAGELVGEVRGEASGIVQWLKGQKREGARRVIFSTYQSSHQTAQALRDTKTRAAVLICDEAHRTAGIRPIKSEKKKKNVRSFTICHRSKDMPARTRIYMTATPRIFAMGEAKKDDHVAKKWEVSTMNDLTTFGPISYKLSYRNAVKHKYLTDYRIVAVGVPDDAYGLGNEIASRNVRVAEAEGGNTDSRGHNTSLAMRKLAYGLALGGGVPDLDGNGHLSIRSSIAFCNRISRSKELVADLDKEKVRTWIKEKAGGRVGKVEYSLEHRDSSDGAVNRELALEKLRAATDEKPYGVCNVGIFGEGVDTPDLSAVAFIEPRKSPVDVIQAVGRVMRRSSKKEIGLIIVPLTIPVGQCAESWLESQTTDEGWEELGQVLKALRAHDDRIEHALGNRLTIVAPKPPKKVPHLVTIKSEPGSIVSFIWAGCAGSIEPIISDVDDQSNVLERLREKGEVEEVNSDMMIQQRPYDTIIVDDTNPKKPKVAGVCAKVTYRKESEGYPVAPAVEKAQELLTNIGGKRGENKIKLRKPRHKETKRKSTFQGQLTLLDSLGPQADAIRVNLLEKSGLLSGSKRDFNILNETVQRASHHLREDSLERELRIQLGMDKIQQTEDGADACTVTALLLMMACIVQARLEQGKVMEGREIQSLVDVQASGAPAEELIKAWNKILEVDYQPVFTLSRNLLTHLTREVRKTVALDAALRGIAKDAAGIAETYATMGMDFAGELFNKVMGNQASDGAYFTKPTAAMLLAELVVESMGDVDWKEKETWGDAHAFDPTCGSGTLLIAYMNAMERRAREQGIDEKILKRLRRYAVEHGVVGLDINPVSLQLAGAQLIIGDIDARYKRMGLWEMPYGKQGDDPNEPARAGSLELLVDKRVVGESEDDDLFPETLLPYKTAVSGQQIGLKEDEPAEQKGKVEDVVDAVVGRRVVLTNPPFVTRSKLGKKFKAEEQEAIRRRIDAGQAVMDARCAELKNITGKNTTGPLYVGLGLRCIARNNGILGMVLPTIGLLAPTGLQERKILAKELHIRYVVTAHDPKHPNMSQNTAANESLVIGTRDGRETNRPTTFVSIGSMPETTGEVLEIVEAIRDGSCVFGVKTRQVSKMRLQKGDWSAAGWSDPTLDEVTEVMESWDELVAIGKIKLDGGGGVTVRAPGHGIMVPFDKSGTLRKVMNSKAESRQTRLSGEADSEMQLKRNNGESDSKYIKREKLQWAKWTDKCAAHLMLCTGQNLASARVGAVVCTERTIGMVWKPVQGVDIDLAKAWAVWLNSTLGRIELFRHRGGKGLGWPRWQPQGLREVLVPCPHKTKAINRLKEAWEDTKDIKVPQYQEGYTEVRQEWDRAVCEAIASADKEQVKVWAAKLNREAVVVPKKFLESIS